MPLHPQAALAIQRAGDLPTDLTPAELRVAYERNRLTLLPERPQVAITYELSIPSDYGPIRARFYRASRDAAPCPLLVYFHGGGFMLGTLALYDTACRRLALAGECAVLSVDYRLAPESIFPAAVLDAYAATRWASDNAELLNIDPVRIAGLKADAYRNDVAELLDWVGLGERMHAMPPTLSGGEKQRLAIARAVVGRPEILLADEPTGNVDPDMASRLLRLFVELNKLGSAILIASHDQTLVARSGQPVLHLAEGRLSEGVPVAPARTAP